MRLRARIETMDAWTGRDVGRRLLCRASPSDRSVTLFDVKFVSPRETRSKHIVSSRDDAGPNGTRRARARRKEDVARVRVEYLRGGQSACSAERERERATLGARLGSVFGRTVRRDGRTERSPVPPQLGAQHVFRRRRQLHHAVVSLDGRERVRRGPSRPAPDPLTEPPHVQPPARDRRAAAAAKASPPAAAAPSPRPPPPPFSFPSRVFSPARTTFLRLSSPAGCSAARSPPARMPFTKSRRRVRQELRVVPPESKMAPPACPLPPRRPPTVAPRPSPTRARRACAVFSSP